APDEQWEDRPEEAGACHRPDRDQERVHEHVGDEVAAEVALLLEAPERLLAKLGVGNGQVVRHGANVMDRARPRESLHLVCRKVSGSRGGSRHTLPYESTLISRRGGCYGEKPFVLTCDAGGSDCSGGGGCSECRY